MHFSTLHSLSWVGGCVQVISVPATLSQMLGMLVLAFSPRLPVSPLSPFKINNRPFQEKKKKTGSMNGSLIFYFHL